MTQSVLMLGCGNMGGALLTRWAGLEDLAFTVVDPVAPQISANVRHVQSVDALQGASYDALIVAVKPQLIAEACLPAAQHLRAGGVVISIAAGASAATTSAACAEAPVIRLMPNMPARLGLGVSGLYAEPGVKDEYRVLAQTLAEAVGSAIWLENEDGIDRITAVAGSGPGYVFEFARAYQAAAQELGFSEDEARQLVGATMLGAISLAEREGTAFEPLRNSIMSPAGTTAAGIAALNEEGGLSDRLSAALRAAYDRAVALRD